ncbi:hypothetical protein FQN52_007780 [Onygenales sp. PD_12]|nr:hypothetical protein FQN52_007780 [Onygenales sp. PD_12]
MAPFFGKFRGNAGSGNPASTSSPAKKDHAPPPMTPLERMLLDVGPLRHDGSDKFFGMENAQYGNTCYCNSILQCLYYSVPFRESVINYPRRAPIEALNTALAKNLRYPDPDAQIEEPPKKPAVTPTMRGPGVVPMQPQKPEDKDSPEYKKKVAINTLPLLETTDNAASYGMQESLFTSLKDIFEAVVASQERMGVIRPYTFLEVLRREHEMFRTAMHQDAHEFLNLLLNEVVANVEAEAKRLPAVEPDQHSESGDASEQATTTGSVATTLTASNGSRSPNTTRWVHELFEGTLTSETQCLTCEKVSQRDEVFLDLSVDLDQHSSVTSCLRKFSEEEMLCERNKFHCDTCGGLQEAEKRMKIKRLPRILALHLKRFKYTEDLQRLQKLFHRVVYPYYLRLFNTTDDAEDPDRLYELYAVVVHIGGGPYHGHYVAIIKTPDRGWLLFDDEMVEPVDKSYVQNFFGDRPGLACAYVLFYQETTFEAMQKEQEQERKTPAAAATRASVDTKDLVSPLQHKMNGSLSGFQDINRVNTAAPAPAETHGFSPLKKAPTAPQQSTHPENATPSPLPPLPPTPLSPPLPLTSKKSDVHAKKERAKEEKERKAAEKAAEKEREKAEKQKRKDIETRYRETAKKQDAELKAAMEASKVSKAEEDRRNVKENGSSGGLTGSLTRFKLGSRSLSHGRLSKEKDRVSKAPDVPPVPILPSSNPTTKPTPEPAAENTTTNDPLEGEPVKPPPPQRAMTEQPRYTTFPATAQVPPPNAITNMKVRPPIPPLPEEPNDSRHTKTPKQATTKRSRFSLRKKSFSVI